MSELNSQPTDFIPFFEKRDNENFLVRNTAEKFINELNRYSVNPFAVENVTSIRSKVPYFPINWDFDQFYLFIYSLLTRNRIAGNTMVLTVNENEVVDWFLVLPHKKERVQLNAPLKYEITFSIEDMPKNDHTIKFIKETNDLIQNYDPTIDFKKKIEEFLKIMNLNIDYFFFIPFDLIDFLAGLKLPPFNEDVVNYFEKAIAWFDYYDLKKIEYFDPLKMSLRLSPTFFGFIALKNMTDTADIIPIKELALYLLEFIEGREFNLLLLDNNIPFILAHTSAEHDKLKLNPVSFSSLRGTDWLQINDWNTFYDFLFKRTGRDSIIIEINDISRILNEYQQNRITTLEMCLDVFTMIYSSPVAHRYTLSRFFEIFGFRFDEGIKDFTAKVKILINMLESVLVVLINEENKGKEILHIMEIHASEDEHIHFDFLQHRALKPYTYTGLDTLKEIKKDSQAQTKRTYNLTFGIKLNDLKNTISAEKMTEILGIKNFYTQLPAFTSVFALILSMKVYDEERFHPQKSVLTKIEPPENEDFKALTEEIKKFLAKGIFILTEPGFPLNTIRSEDGKKTGLFGFDFEKILKKVHQNK